MEVTGRADERRKETCQLCGRPRPLTQHHLIPRFVHSKKRFAKRYSKQEMKTRLLLLCRPCHVGLHQLFSERELAENFPTREQLLGDERVQKLVRWARKQK